MKTKAARAALETYLKTHGIRQSTTRDRFFNLLLAFSHHMELTDLIEKAKAHKIAEASVYRSLKLFLDAGLVSKLQGPGGKTFYEITSAHHDHMICLSCGKIIEFNSPQIEKLQADVAKRVGFTIQFHVHELRGLCSNCQK